MGVDTDVLLLNLKISGGLTNEGETASIMLHGSPNFNDRLEC